MISPVPSEVMIHLSRKYDSSAVGGQNLSERIRAINTIWIVRKRIKAESGRTVDARGNCCGSQPRKRILKNSGGSGSENAPLLNRRDGKALFLCGVNYFAFERRKVKRLFGDGASQY